MDRGQTDRFVLAYKLAVVSSGNSTQAKLRRLRDLLRSGNETVAVAESVTSGHVQALLSLAPDASTFFEGGITTYNARQKVRNLAIDPVHALRHNCVSDRVSMEMALGASRVFVSDWAIGITGYATAMPEAGIKSLFAFVAVAHDDRIVHVQRIDTLPTESEAVQAFYAETVIDVLIHCLKVSSGAVHAS